MVFLASPDETAVRLRGVAPGDDNYPRHVENSSDCIDASLQKNKQMWLLRFRYQEKNGSIVCTLATQLTSLQRSTLHISDRKTGFLSISFQENVTIESESGLDAYG